MKLSYDNEVVLHTAKNPIFNEWAKRIEIDCHFARERIIAGDLDTDYVSSKYKVANILTKPLRKQNF